MFPHFPVYNHGTNHTHIALDVGPMDRCSCYYLECLNLITHCAQMCEFGEQIGDFNWLDILYCRKTFFTNSIGRTGLKTGGPTTDNISSNKEIENYPNCIL